MRELITSPIHSRTPRPRGEVSEDCGRKNSDDERSDAENSDNEDFDCEELSDSDDAWENAGSIKLPEPGEFEAPCVAPNVQVSLRERFRNSGLQVIVKLANIELVPESPRYEGGTWHVEGQLVSGPLRLISDFER